MEVQFLNRAELRGVVRHEPKVYDVGEKRVARFSVMTTDGDEVTYHNVTVWDGPEIVGFDDIKRGREVWLKGRLRSHKYIGFEGVERTVVEILAGELKVM